MCVTVCVCLCVCECVCARVCACRVVLVGGFRGLEKYREVSSFLSLRNKPPQNAVV